MMPAGRYVTVSCHGIFHQRLELQTPLLISVEFFLAHSSLIPFWGRLGSCPWSVVQTPVNFGQETQTSLFSKPANQQLARFEKPVAPVWNMAYAAVGKENFDEMVMTEYRVNISRPTYPLRVLHRHYSDPL